MNVVSQAQIPTLPLLYKARKLVAATAAQPLFAASSVLNSKIGLIRYDITRLELPNGGIVNAANHRLLGGGGVDGAIHRAAGPGLLQECQGLGGAKTGQSKITDAYQLPCRKVIHTVGPIYDLEQESHLLLESCYKTSLQLAVDAGLDSIAFSAVSTGIYGYPSGKAARVALKAVRDFLETEAGSKLGLVAFCNFERKDEDAYHQLIPLYFPPEEAPAAAPEEAPAAAPEEAPAAAPEEAPAAVNVSIMMAEADDEAVAPNDNTENFDSAVDGSKDEAKQDEGARPISEVKAADENKEANAAESKPTVEAKEEEEVKSNKRSEILEDGGVKPSESDSEWAKVWVESP